MISYTSDPQQPSQDLNLQFQNQNLVCCQLHQRAMTGLSGYDPKSEVLETTVLSVYTTDLEKLIKIPPPQSGKRYQITGI